MSIEKIQSLLKQTESLISYISQDDFLKKDERSERILLNTKKNLTDKRYVVSVIAAMKAGKSTTFNALLGRDILPNETEACTAAVTEIKHAQEAGTIVKKIYRNGKAVEIKGTKELSLEKQFLKDVRESRKKNEVASIDRYYLESPILAIENSAYRDIVQNFILVDTPGPNEANDGKFDVSELQRIGLEKLRDSDALIMLFDYQTFKSDTNATILKNIFENRDDLERDQEKVYFLVNKIDAMRERDGSIENVIANVKQLIRQYAPIIKDPKVYAFSAKQANLARAVLTGHATDELKKEIELNYGSKYSKNMEIDGVTYTVIPKPEQFAEQLLQESNILEIEEKIIEQMFTRSSEKIIDNALDRLNQVTSNILSAVQAQIDVSTQDAESLQSSVRDSKEKIETLRNEGEILKEIPKKQFNELIKSINGILRNIQKNVDTVIENSLPENPVIEGTNELALRQQAEAIQQTMIQGIQLTLNRDVDKIQRLALDCQMQINEELNQEFQNLSSMASKMIGQNITMKFQVFNMGDIKGNFSIDGDLAISEDIETLGKNDNSGLLSSVLKGAGLGLGAGIIIPGAGNIVGAIIGGIGGFLTHLFSDNSERVVQKVYKVELTPIKEQIVKNSKEVVKKVINELQVELDTSQTNYMNFIESQLDVFINNLKAQLDEILIEYNKNKENIQQHIENMDAIIETINLHSLEIRKIEMEQDEKVLLNV